MITEKVIIVGIMVTGIVLMCLIGSVCDVIKKKGDRNHEQQNDDRL